MHNFFLSCWPKHTKASYIMGLKCTHFNLRLFSNYIYIYTYIYIYIYIYIHIYKEARPLMLKHFLDAEIKINLYQNDKEKNKYGEGLEQLMIQHHLWNLAEKCDGRSMHGFQWHWVWCLVMTGQRTEAAGRILKCIGIYSLPRFSQMQQSWLVVQVEMTQNTQQKQPRRCWR